MHPYHLATTTYRAYRDGVLRGRRVLHIDQRNLGRPREGRPRVFNDRPCVQLRRLGGDGELRDHPETDRDGAGRLAVE